MDLDPSQLFHLQLLNAAQKHGDEIALMDSETRESLTFTGFYKKCFQFAAILSAHMAPVVVDRDRDQTGAHSLGTVLVLLPNCIHYPVIFCGAALLGHPICGVSPDSTKEELHTLARKTDARFVVCQPQLLERVKSALAGSEVKILVFGKVAASEKHPHERVVGLDVEMLTAAFDEELVATLSARSRALATVDDVLIAPLSSGSGGEPKCVLLTHKNFISATQILKRGLFDKLSQDGGKRSNLAFLPFYHASGFWALCFCLLNGHCSVIMNTFQPLAMMQCIQEYRIDVLNLVPSLVGYLTSNAAHFSGFDLSSLKTVLCGSAPIGRVQISEFLAQFPQVQDFVQGYGMTEVVCLSHITPLGASQDGNEHFGSCGKLLEGFEAMIVDPETHEVKTGPREPGELWLRSDCVMRGYLHDEENTAKSLDEDGWLRTGDVLFVDEDGFYYVVDRLKDMIKVNGLQVSPVELERVLVSSELVLEAAVVGIQDADSGQVPCAFVVLDKERISGAGSVQQALEQVKGFVHARVSPYKQLRGGLISLDKLPKTSTGKVLKTELSRIAIAEHETVL